MQILNWEEILKSDLQYIYILGYGSLLNQQTHHSSHQTLIPVSTKGYKRSFSLSYAKDRCENVEYKKRFTLSANELREDITSPLNELTYISNSGSLTVEKDEDYSLNGLLIKIDRKDFESYAYREYKYKLHEIEIEYFDDKQDFLKPTDKVFILVAEDEELQDTSIYYLYQKTCRVGAYNISNDFGIFYDNTTFSYNGEPAYKELNEKIFKPGNKFIIQQNLITINKFPGERENIIKNDGKSCILLENNDYLAKVLITETGDTLWIDTGDLTIAYNYQQ